MATKKWLAAKNLLTMPWGEQEAAQFYPDAVVSGIAATLPRFVNPKARKIFPAAIRKWAAGYMLLKRDAGAQLSESPKVTKASLSRFQKAAASLWGQYVTLGVNARIALLCQLSPERPQGILSLGGAEKILRQIMDGVRFLKFSAEGAGNSSPSRKGRPKAVGRQIAVNALAHIYKEATGQRPTLSRNSYTEKHYGPFRAFCIAALTPIEGVDQARTGIDALITRILYVQK